MGKLRTQRPGYVGICWKIDCVGLKREYLLNWAWVDCIKSLSLHRYSWNLFLVSRGSCFRPGRCISLPRMPFVFLTPTACPFRVLCLSCVWGGPWQVFTYSSNFFCLVVLTDWHATLYNLCLAESHCHAFCHPFKIKNKYIYVDSMLFYEAFLLSKVSVWQPGCFSQYQKPGWC